MLWLSENQIKKLDNLDHLDELQEFNIAQNKIEHIKNSLDKLTKLEELNLAGNKIYSFREIKYLNRLPNLIDLKLYDPHYGENPICNLCNY